LIRSIEGLRGIAALLVALFHAYVYGKWGGLPAKSGVLQHAWLFVDLFFVISGYVMASAYGERLDSMRSAASYMVRRFFRLYPLHIVTTATVLLAVVGIQTVKLILAHYGFKLGNEAPFDIEFFNLKLLGLDLLLLQGLGIMRMEIHNYPSWSISVEFWLYLMFALFMLAVRRRGARIVSSAAIVVMSLTYFLVYWSTVPPELQTLDTRGLPRGMLSFFQGVLLFYLYQRLAGRLAGADAVAGAAVPVGQLSSSGARDPGRWPTGLVSVIQVAAAMLALYLVSRQPALGTWQLVIPFSFTLLVLSLLPDSGVLATLLQTAPMQWLGQHSYSIYLTHVTVLTVLDWPGRVVPEPAKHLVGLVYIALVFGLSALTYRYIESPWRERGKGIARRVETAGAFAGQADPTAPR
jgi:peptidoglycan/LPS O-acetylase OafA/YrhL